MNSLYLFCCSSTSISVKNASLRDKIDVLLGFYTTTYRVSGARTAFFIVWVYLSLNQVTKLSTLLSEEKKTTFF